MHSCMIIYIDDFLIFSKSEMEHITQAWTVLKKLLEIDMLKRVLYVHKLVHQDSYLQ